MRTMLLTNQQKYRRGGAWPLTAGRVPPHSPADSIHERNHGGKDREERAVVADAAVDALYKRAKASAAARRRAEAARVREFRLDARRTCAAPPGARRAPDALGALVASHAARGDGELVDALRAVREGLAEGRAAMLEAREIEEWLEKRRRAELRADALRRRLCDHPLDLLAQLHKEVHRTAGKPADSPRKKRTPSTEKIVCRRAFVCAVATRDWASVGPAGASFEPGVLQKKRWPVTSKCHGGPIAANVRIGHVGAWGAAEVAAAAAIVFDQLVHVESGHVEGGYADDEPVAAMFASVEDARTRLGEAGEAPAAFGAEIADALGTLQQRIAAAEHYLANAAAATAQCVAAHRVAMGGAGDAEARILRHLRSLAGWWARQAVTFDACVCITCTPRGVKRVGGGYDIYDWGQAAWVRAQAHLALRQLCADSPPRPGSAASAAGALAWHDLSRSAVGRRARAAAADASPSAEDAKDDASGANEWPVDQPGGAPVEGDGAALAADNQGPGDTDEFEESAGPADDPGDDAANDAFEEFMERRAG